MLLNFFDFFYKHGFRIMSNAILIVGLRLVLEDIGLCRFSSQPPLELACLIAHDGWNLEGRVSTIVRWVLAWTRSSGCREVHVWISASHALTLIT